MITNRKHIALCSLILICAVTAFSARLEADKNRAYTTIQSAVDVANDGFPSELN